MEEVSSCFTVKAKSRDCILNWDIESGSRQRWDLQIRDYHFSGETSSFREWSADGPEGFVYNIPGVPLHWYVHSVASNAIYQLTLPSGQVVKPSRSIGHLEKNWGSAFPKRWLWAQAVSIDGLKQVVLAGGDLGMGTDKIPVVNSVFLVKIRTSQFDFTWNPLMAVFNPVQITKLDKTGILVFKGHHGDYIIHVSVTAPSVSFEYCLCPTNKGFLRDSIESYASMFEVTIMDKQMNIRERFTISNGALEFGGDFMTQ